MAEELVLYGNLNGRKSKKVGICRYTYRSDSFIYTVETNTLGTGDQPAVTAGRFILAPGISLKEKGIRIWYWLPHPMIEATETS